jgi:hypothetical protein
VPHTTLSPTIWSSPKTGQPFAHTWYPRCHLQLFVSQSTAQHTHTCFEFRQIDTTQPRSSLILICFQELINFVRTSECYFTRNEMWFIAFPFSTT